MRYRLQEKHQRRGSRETWKGSELSEENEKYQKKVEGNFGEKRLLGGYA